MEDAVSHSSATVPSYAASDAEDICHEHALFVQPAQTLLSFDIWLMLSRGTAAGYRKQRTGRTVAA